MDLLLVSALFNFLSMAGNIYYSYRLKSIQVHKENTDFYRNQVIDLKESLIETRERKKIYKAQYQHLAEHHATCNLQNDLKKVYSEVTN